MADLKSTGGTATVSANTNSVAIANYNLALVKPGMVIYLGSQGSRQGVGYEIQTVSVSGSNGGTLTTVDAIPNGVTGVPFRIDTGTFGGSASALAVSQVAEIINAMRETLGASQSLSGDREIRLNKKAAGNLGRMLFGTDGEEQFAIESRQVNGVEKLCLRAGSDVGGWTDMIVLSPGAAKAALAGYENVDNTSDDVKSKKGNKVGDAIVATVSLARSDIPGVIIPLNAFVVSGHATVGDGGEGAIYVRGTSTGLAAIQDAAGTWWNLYQQKTMNPRWFGAVGNNANNDTAALQACLNLALNVYVPRGKYLVTALSSTKNRQQIYGDGPGSVILGGWGGDAASHILTMGDNVSDIYGCSIRNVNFWSKVTRTGGSAVLWYRARQAIMQNVRAGDLEFLYTGGDVAAGPDNHRLFNGVTWINFDACVMDACQLCGGTGDALTCAGPVFSSELTWTGGGQVLAWANRGINAAGNVGALKLLSGGVALCRIGLHSTTELAAAVNREIFVSAQFSLDSCKDYNCALGPNSFYIFEADMLWVCSAGRDGAGAPISGALGYGISIDPVQVNGHRSIIKGIIGYNNVNTAALLAGNYLVGPSKIYSNGGSGIYIRDQTLNGHLIGVDVEYNTQYGAFVDATLVTAARANPATKTLQINASLAIGNMAGDTSGLSGTTAGRYLVDGCIGYPNS